MSSNNINEFNFKEVTEEDIIKGSLQSGVAVFYMEDLVKEKVLE